MKLSSLKASGARVLRNLSHLNVNAHVAELLHVLRVRAVLRH
jgi:hypothetical protein